MATAIRQGPAEPLKCTCPKCKSLIGYLPIEVQKKNYTDISQSRCTQEFILCPSCGETIVTGGD